MLLSLKINLKSTTGLFMMNTEKWSMSPFVLQKRRKKSTKNRDIWNLSIPMSSVSKNRTLKSLIIATFKTILNKFTITLKKLSQVLRKRARKAPKRALNLWKTRKNISILSNPKLSKSKSNLSSHIPSKAIVKQSYLSLKSFLTLPISKYKIVIKKVTMTLRKEQS